MATLSLGSGLVNKITNKVFSDNFYQAGNQSGGYDYATQLDATKFGMGGYGGSVTNNSYYNNGYSNGYGASLGQKPSYFSLMKGVVPSAISDVSSNQRASDIIITYSGPAPNRDATALLTTSSDNSLTYNGGYVAPNDFLVTVTGGTATWSALNLSFLPRYPIASGTPTWFWFRTNALHHNIIGTVGATGSGSDLELQTYAYIDATKEYTLYNATMAVFQLTQEINY